MVMPPAVTPEPAARPSRFWLGFGAGCGTSLVLAAVMAAALAAVGMLAPSREGEADADAALDEAFDAAVAEINAAVDDGDFDRAESAARRLASGRPDDPEAQRIPWDVRIGRLVSAEDASGAAAMLAEAHAKGIEPDGGVQLGVAELWLDEGEAARALEIAERVVAASPGVDDDERWVRGAGLLVRGLARRELGDPQGAVADLRAAVDLAPDEETAREWRGYLEETEESAR